MTRAIVLCATLASMTLGCASRVFRPTHVVDLSQTLSPRLPFIPAQGKTFAFRITPIATLADNGVNANKWELTEHNGTHLDAPLHFAPHGASIEQISVGDLFVAAVVIDMRDAVAKNPDARLGVDDVLRWEHTHGRIRDGVAVLVHTGWAARAQQLGAYVNMDAAGIMHFPGIDSRAIEFLVAQRRIVGVGIDTLSVDPGTDTKYPDHHALFAAGKWALEVLTGLEQLPATGATLVVGAVKVEGATGSPSRVIAFW